MYYKKSLQIVVLLIVSFFTPGLSQDKPKLDSNYISCYRHLITLRPFYKTEDLRFQVETRDGDLNLDFVPNNNKQVGLAFNWDFVGIAIGTNRPFAGRQIEEKGETSSLDIRSTVFARKFATDLYYLKYQGFYIKNTHEIWPDWEEGNYFKRPDLVATSFGVNGYYLFNGSKYSMRAMYIQNEGQRRSAGSIVLKPSFRVLEISSDSTQLAQETAQTLKLTGELVNSRFRIFGVAPGYAHTLVWKGFYVNSSLLPGATLQRHLITTRQGDLHKRWMLNYKIQSRLSVGVNKKDFYAGMALVTDKYFFVLRHTRFNFTVSQFRTWIGIRFG